MPQAHELGRLLARLGRTAEAVADTLNGEDIRGARNTVRHLNPVVRYLQRHLRIDDYELSLPHTDGHHKVSMISPSGSSTEMELPPAIAEFLTRFNRGDFPELELPPPATQGQ